jgi:hypothetical protein
MGFGDSVRKAGDGLNALLVLGFLGIVWLMIYGNLSGNLGFAASTQGYNDTQAVITNMTGGAKTFFGFSNTLFTIMAIVLLITILLALLAVVLKISSSSKKGGFSSYE